MVNAQAEWLASSTHIVWVAPSTHAAHITWIDRMFMPWGFAFGTCMPDHASGETVCDGSLLGLWQEKTIAVLRSSPYWTPEVNAKFTFAVGGWAASDGSSRAWHDGYGADAAVRSPSTSVLNIAGYNGGCTCSFICPFLSLTFRRDIDDE